MTSSFHLALIAGATFGAARQTIAVIPIISRLSPAATMALIAKYRRAAIVANAAAIAVVAALELA